MFFLRLAILAWLLIFPAAISPTQAENSSEPLLKEFQERFQKPYFNIGFLQQTVGDFQIERSFSGQNGFNISNFRLKIYGEFDGGFGYYLQTNFIQQPAILDARIYYRLSPSLQINAGLYKAPFSGEYLISAASIDFVNRSRVVSALIPGRQIGMMLDGSLLEKTLSYQAGIFNGNGFQDNGNDNQHFMYVGRLLFERNIPLNSEDNLQLKIGINAAISRDSLLNFNNLHLSAFTGTRRLLGTDVRLTAAGFLLAAEYLWSQFDPRNGIRRSPDGYYLTIGKMITPKSQLLFRWDSIKGDGLFSADDWFILGFNWWPTGVSEIQINYIIDSGNTDVKNNQLLINFQIGI